MRQPPAGERATPRVGRVAIRKLPIRAVAISFSAISPIPVFSSVAVFLVGAPGAASKG